METQQGQIELEKTHQIGYAFVLTAFSAKTPKLQANFSPLKCKNSCKYINTIPTYMKETFTCFSTQVGRLTLKKTHSLQHLSSKENFATEQTLIPKPSHNYCQICKQRFHDYLQHIEHPIHKRKSRQASSQYSIDSLKEILKTSRKLKRKETWAPNSQPSQLSQYSLDSYSISSKNSHDIDLKMEQIDKLSITSSTNNRQFEDQRCQDPSTIIRPRQKRKYSNFRTLKNDRNEESKMDVEQ